MFRLIVLSALLSFHATASDMFVYFGTSRTGTNLGFSLSKFDTKTGALTKPELLIEAKAPVFFVIHPDGKHLYTCNGGNPGEVSAYSIDPKTAALTFLNKAPNEGGSTYISLDKTARYALVANYNGGTIAVFALKPDGSLGDRTAFIQHTGSSVHPQRQTKPYAHSIIIDPSNRFALVADLGVDKVFVYRFNEKDGTLTPNDPPAGTLSPGSGPRHIRFHPNGRWFYSINELASTVTAFNWNSTNGTLAEFQTISTLPADFKGQSTCAEIEVHPSGKFLYGSNRGHDSLVAFAVDETNGRLTFLQHVPSQGKSPRNFAFDPTAKWILCSSHGGNNAVVFRVNENTGMLTQTGDPIPVPNPFCERFLPIP